MSKDYYATLGVDQNASAEEIQKAYRRLVRKYHPDLKPDDATAKEKFKQVQTAFDVLNDTKKRQLYDQYGSAYESMDGGGQAWQGGGGFGGQGGFGGWNRAGQGRAGGSGGHEFNLDDLFGQGGDKSGGGFADLFKNLGQRGGPRQPRATAKRGANLQHELTVPLTTAVSGGEAQITVHRSNGKIETLQVRIPPGIDDGKKIRLREQGEPGPGGSDPGDILITVRVAPHPIFRRTGKRLDVRVPITLFEAIHGAKIDLPTPQGTITLSIPPGTSSGNKLRVKGHGVVTSQSDRGTDDVPGDLFAEIQIVLPKSLNDVDQKNLESIASKYNDDPRADIRW